MKKNNNKKMEASRNKIKAIEQNNGKRVMTIVAIMATIMLIHYLPKSYGIFFPQDEFGYWNNAAKIIGLDWSDVAFGQSRYAYGYSLLLVPILVLLKSNPLMLYKVAITLNVVLLVIYSGLLYKIVKKIFTNLTETQKSILTIICTFTPYVIGYVHYTIAEMLIHVLFVSLLNAIYDADKAGVTKIVIIKCSVICVAMLLVHYRTIGVTFAFGVVLLVKYLKDVELKRMKLITLVTFSLALIATIYIIFRMGYFSFDKLLTSENMISLIIGFIGKLYYSIVATFGLGFIGLLTLIKNRKSTFSSFYILAFFTLCFISAYFFIGSQRIDHLVYGRYIEMFLPLLTCLGINEVIEHKLSLRQLTAVVIITIILSITMFFYAAHRGLIEYVPNFVSGIDWMLGNRASSVLMLYIKPMYVTVIFLIIIAILKKRDFFAKMILISVLAITLLSSKWVIDHEVYFFQECDTSDYDMSLQIKELTMKRDDLLFLDSPYNNYINLMQYWLMDKKITLLQGLDSEAFNTPADAIVITHANYEALEQLQERYNVCLQSAHFYLFYNE